MLMAQVEMARPAFEHAAALFKSRLSTPHVRIWKTGDRRCLVGARLDFANTPAHAVDDVHASTTASKPTYPLAPAPPTKPEIDTFAKRKKKRCDDRIASARKSSTRDPLQHA